MLLGCYGLYIFGIDSYNIQTPQTESLKSWNKSVLAYGKLPTGKTSVKQKGR